MKKHIIVLLLLTIACTSVKFVKNPNYQSKKINSIAIFPFSGNKEFGASLASHISLHLIENNITVVERSEINKILNEQGLSMTGLIDNDKIIEAGKLSGADAVLLGTVVYKQVQWFYQGTYIVKNGIGTASIRLIDTETGELIGGVKFKNGDGVANFTEDIDDIANDISEQLLKGIGKK